MQKDIQQTVKKIFTDYLERKSHRKTEERFTILEEVYNLDDHFDVESLFLYMKNKDYSISRATIYNTIELLMDCDLITKHQFGKNTARFERSHSFRQHDHLICSDCEHVFEFCDPRIQQIQSMIGEILNFAVTNHSLNLFGKCNELADKGTCKHKKVNEIVEKPK